MIHWKTRCKSRISVRRNAALYQDPSAGMRKKGSNNANLTKCRISDTNLMHSLHSLIRIWKNPDDFFSPKLRNNLASLCPSKSSLHGENRCFPVTRSTVSSHQQQSASKQAQTRPGSDQHAEQQGENYIFFFTPQVQLWSQGGARWPVPLYPPASPLYLGGQRSRSRGEEQFIVLLRIAELQSVLNELRFARRLLHFLNKSRICHGDGGGEQHV